MLYLFETDDYAKARHQEMIAEAKAYSKAYSYGGNTLQQLGHLLVQLGQKMQGQSGV